MFLTVEGLDGSGKTTVIDAVTERYPNTVTTSEPPELWTGKTLRRCLKDESIEPLTDFFFFMGDRVEHIEKEIRPAVNENKMVISDRYADSTRAYQPVALEKSNHFETQTDAKLFIESTMASWEFKPDLTVYIDVSVDTALERCGEEDKYETKEYLTAVKRNYDKMVQAERERFVIVDGEKPKESVARLAVSKLDLPSLDRI